MFGEIDHIGFVFKNVEEAVKKFKNIFGIEEVMRFDYGIVKGARFLIGKQSKLRIDLIEPQDTNSIFYSLTLVSKSILKCFWQFSFDFVL